MRKRRKNKKRVQNNRFVRLMNVHDLRRLKIENQKNHNLGGGGGERMVYTLTGTLYAPIFENKGRKINSIVELKIVSRSLHIIVENYKIKNSLLL